MEGDCGVQWVIVEARREGQLCAMGNAMAARVNVKARHEMGTALALPAGVGWR